MLFRSTLGIVCKPLVITHLPDPPRRQILIKGCCTIKHMHHLEDMPRVPTTNVLIKGLCIMEYITHAPDLARIPLAKDRKSTRLNSSHVAISYAVFCLKKKQLTQTHAHL